MPRPSKGPRLRLRPARGTRKAHWVILDDSTEISTGCGPNDRGGAERKLTEYLAGKHVSKVSRDVRDPSEIPIADVIALYARDIAPSTARPKETSKRLDALLDFFGADMLDTLNGGRCREFAAGCATDSAARRRLEELRAAINHHRKEGLCSKIVEVVLPPKRPHRERWLTRKEAAHIIRRAWRFREIQKGHATGRRSRQHVAKFTLVGLYTGSRAGRICGASFYPTRDHGYIDVERGVFYRRAPATVETKKRAPAIKLPDRLLAHLRRWKAKGQRFVVEFNGRPVKRVSKAFDRICGDLELEDVMPHTLRHTAATWMMQVGTPTWEAAGYLGMSEKTLIDNYGHHHPDHLEGARNAFTRMRRVK